MHHSIKLFFPFECRARSDDLGVHPEAVVEEVNDVDSNAFGVRSHVIGRHDDYTNLIDEEKIVVRNNASKRGCTREHKKENEICQHEL